MLKRLQLASKSKAKPKSDPIKSTIIEAGPRLDLIPQENALVIINFIQDKVQAQKSKDEREKARRVRDAALHSVALSCRKTFSIWHPFLLSNVTISALELFSFYELLKNNEPAASMIKSLELVPAKQLQMKEMRLSQARVLQRQFLPFSRLPFSAQLWERMEDGYFRVAQLIYERVVNLQSLNIRKDLFLLWTVNEPAQPFGFFHSLKKLSIPMWGDNKLILRAPNVVWILVFCPQLFEVDLGVCIDPADADFLLEHSQYLSGISNVKHLSLAFRHIKSGSSDKRNWLGSVKEGGKSCDKMTRSIMNLLNLTNKGLISLDLAQASTFSTHFGPPENMQAFASCLSSLHRSFATLQTLRTNSIGPDGYNPFDTDYSIFQSLKYLFVDQASLYWLANYPTIRLPLSLEVIVLPFYILRPVESVPLDIQVDEEGYLATLLRTRSLPMLREVIVPTQLINMKPRSNEAESPALQKIWRERRAALEKESVFTSGKVKLTTAKQGEIVGDSSSGQIYYMSMASWMSQ